MQQFPSTDKGKTFWERPEGTTGMIFLAFITAGVGWGLYILLPFIIILLQNVITAIGLGVALFCIIWVLSDKRFRTLAWYFYKSVMRFLTNIFIEIDPIGILQNYVSDLKKKRREMGEQIGKLRGQMQSLRELIARNKAEVEQSLALAQQAHKKGKKAVLTLQARRAGRRRDANISYEDLLRRMEMLYRVLNKMFELAGIAIEDKEDEVEVATRKRAAINAGYSVLKRATAIFNGDSDRAEIYNMTLQHLADDFGRKLGEIEHFMEMSSTFMETIDLQNGVYEEDAMAAIEAWEEESDMLFLGEGVKEQLVQISMDSGEVLDLSEEPEKELVEREEQRKRRFERLVTRGHGA